MSPVPASPPKLLSGPKLSRQTPGREGEKARKLKKLRNRLQELEPGVPGLERKADLHSEKQGEWTSLGLFRPRTAGTDPNSLRLDPARVTGLHDISGACYGDVPAAIGFCRALLAGLSAAVERAAPSPRKTILWAQTRKQAGEFGTPYSPGLQEAGLEASHILFLTASRNTDILWAMEEGLRSNALLAVVGEVTKTGFTATRRLALASAQSLTPGFLIRPGDNGTSAAVTRWRVSASPSAPNEWHETAPGNPRWHLELVRNRGGRPRSFNLEWTHETHTFRLVAAAPHRPPQANTPHTNKSRPDISFRRHLA